MVLYILTSYRVLSIVYLDQLKGACHTHISYHDNSKKPAVYKLILKISPEYFSSLKISPKSPQNYVPLSCATVLYPPFKIF